MSAIRWLTLLGFGLSMAFAAYQLQKVAMHADGIAQRLGPAMQGQNAPGGLPGGLPAGLGGLGLIAGGAGAPAPEPEGPRHAKATDTNSSKRHGGGKAVLIDAGGKRYELPPGEPPPKKP